MPPPVDMTRPVGLVPPPPLAGVPYPPMSPQKLHAFTAASAAGAVAPLPEGPGALDGFLAWFKEDWLMKLGALLLILAFGWLTTYAFMNNWIGPAGRVTIGFFGGVVFLSLGWWRTAHFPRQGGVLFALGAAIVIISALASMGYGFFSPIAALGVIVLSAAFVSAASAVFRLQFLAVLGLLLAFFAPFLTNGLRDPLAIYAYFSFVTLLPLCFALYMGWRGVIATAFLLLYAAPAAMGIALRDAHGTFWYLLFGTFVALVSAYAVRRYDMIRPLTFVSLILTSWFSVAVGGVVMSRAGMLTLLPTALLFGVIYFAATTFAMVNRREDQGVLPDIIAAAGTGLFLLGWVMVAVPENWQSLTVALIALFFAVAAFALLQATGKLFPFHMYGALGIVLVGVATAIQLSGHALGVAFTLEAAAVILVSYVVTRQKRVVELASFALILPGAFALQALHSYEWSRGVFHSSFFLALLFSLVLFSLAMFFREHLANSGSKLPAVLAVVGSLFSSILLWQSAHALFADSDHAVMASLFAYTCVGLATYIAGKQSANRTLSIYGGCFLGFVVVRLLLVDVWAMALSGRIVTFFVVGLLLVGTAFVVRSKKTAIGTPPPPSSL
jgi:uncharacterized membrane protein